jgi:hypothetical protein
MQISFRVQIEWRYVNSNDPDDYVDKTINILLSSRMDRETKLEELIKEFNERISTRITSDNGDYPGKTPLPPKSFRIEYRNDIVIGDAVRFHLYVKSNTQIQWKLTEPSEDAKSVFGDIFDIDTVAPGNAQKQVSGINAPIWNRGNVLVKASFANVDQENFLGHTRSMIYTPIKYFRTTSTDQKFWLEFYLADDNTKQSIFPVTKKSKITHNENGDEVSIDYYDPLVDVMIESVLLFNADSII